MTVIDWTPETDPFAPRQQRTQQSFHSPAVNLDIVLQRIAGDSMNEIDVVIHELESMREMLRRKAERVSVDLAEFASVSHSSTSAMKIISQSLKNLRNGADNER